jgi:hemerythrin-like domain-containing protein
MPRRNIHERKGEIDMTLLSSKVFGAAALVASLAVPAIGAGELPTADFRDEHAETKEHLRHVDGMVRSLDGAPAEEQKRTMSFVAKFLREHILTHATWEEAHLYPLVDQQAGRTGEPFTASMRYEHGIIGRGIEELSELASAETPDPGSFARSADRLLGIIDAHFEKEEEVFLPLIDRSLSRVEVEKALGAPGAH